MNVGRDASSKPARSRQRHIRVHKILALEQQLRPVRFGAGVGQAIAEIQAGAVFAAFAVALERGDGAVGDGLGDRHHLHRAFSQQRGHAGIGGARRYMEQGRKPHRRFENDVACGNALVRPLQFIRQ